MRLKLKKNFDIRNKQRRAARDLSRNELVTAVFIEMEFELFQVVILLCLKKTELVSLPGAIASHTVAPA